LTSEDPKMDEVFDTFGAETCANTDATTDFDTDYDMDSTVLSDNDLGLTFETSDDLDGIDIETSEPIDDALFSETFTFEDLNKGDTALEFLETNIPDDTMSASEWAEIQNEAENLDLSPIEAETGIDISNDHNNIDIVNTDSSQETPNSFDEWLENASQDELRETRQILEDMRASEAEGDFNSFSDEQNDETPFLSTEIESTQNEPVEMVEDVPYSIPHAEDSTASSEIEEDSSFSVPSSDLENETIGGVNPFESTEAQDITPADIQNDYATIQQEAADDAPAVSDYFTEQTDAPFEIEEQIADAYTDAEQETDTNPESLSEIATESDSPDENQILETPERFSDGNFVEDFFQNEHEAFQEVDVLDDLENPVDNLILPAEEMDIDYDAVYEGFDWYDFDGHDYNQNSEQLTGILDGFSEDNWNHLDLNGQKEQISELSGYVNEVLGMESPPHIEYYNKPEMGDYGGYDPETNTLQINEYMLCDSDEAADTVAHELWHAYQHERASNPQSPKDFQYQYGFENYIRPGDDFDGYQSQLVEAEARAFADQFKGEIAQMKGRK